MKKNNLIITRFQKYSTKMKLVTRWQATRLREKGFKNSYIACLLNIHPSTVSSWWTKREKSKTYIGTIASNFGKLSAKDKRILVGQISILESEGIERSEIADILGLPSGAVVSDLLKKSRKHSINDSKTEDKKKPTQQVNSISKKGKNSLVTTKTYRQYENTTKDLIYWQALHLKARGMKSKEISELLAVHTSTISRWYRTFCSLKNDSNTNDNAILGCYSERLTSEMKDVLVNQIILLKKKKVKHEEIAKTLGLLNALKVSRLLHNQREADPEEQAQADPAQADPEVLGKKNIGFEVHSTFAYVKTNLVNNVITRTKIKNIKSNKPQKIQPSLCDSKEMEVKLKRINVLKKRIKLLDKMKRIKVLAKKIRLLKGRKPASTHNSNILDQPRRNIQRREGKSPQFFQADNEGNINLKRDVKIIKANDYAQYSEAVDLVQKSKKTLAESKKRGVEIETEAERSAKLITEEIITKAQVQGKKDADDLLAIKNIEATKAATEYLSSLKNNLPNLIITIVRKFIHNYDDKEFVVQNINSALKEINDNHEIKIHVSQNVIHDVKSRLDNINYPDNKITLVPDASLNNKDCLVVTKLGVINACLETQIKKIENHANAMML